MNVLVTGANGQLGFDVAKELNFRGHCPILTDVTDLDITKLNDVELFFCKNHIEAVIHCAAYTNVDLAEKEKEKCFLINKNGTENIAKACNTNDAVLIYPSTDYVFNGEGNTPFKPLDECSPINVYGHSKYLGELAVQEISRFFIVRISWVFGKNGNNFVGKILSLAKNKGEIKVVDDQIGSPTYTVDLAKLLCDMIESNKYGIYHATNEGFCSWYDFAKEIINLSKKQLLITKCSSKEFNSVAPRPSNSRMDKSDLIKNGFSPLPHWKESLKKYLIEIGEYNDEI